MQETANIGAGQPASSVRATESNPVRGRSTVRHGERADPAFVNKLRGEAPGVRKLAQAAAAVSKQSLGNQRADKALAAAQRRVEQLQKLAQIQQDTPPPPSEQIKAAARFAAVEHDLAAIVESLPPIAGDLLPPLALGSADELAVAISQLKEAGARIDAERAAVEARRETLIRRADELAAQTAAKADEIDEVSARELVAATTRQIESGHQAALNSHASSIVQEAIRALA